MPEPLTLALHPPGQSADLITALGGLLTAALGTTGEVLLTSSRYRYGTAGGLVLMGDAPERDVVAALRTASMLLTSDPQARAEMEQRYRDLTCLDDLGVVSPGTWKVAAEAVAVSAEVEIERLTEARDALQLENEGLRADLMEARNG